MKKQSLSMCLSWLKEKLSILDLHEHTRDQYARWLIQKATGKPFSSLISRYALADNDFKKLEQYLHELRQGKPLGYILSSVPFCGLTINVQPPILIPRMETEEWVDNLINQLKKETVKNLRILDLCTGSGCIAIALAHHLPQATVIGSDIKEEALTCARENAIHNNVSNVTFINSDLFNNLEPQQFDLIISNPPYVSESEYTQLPETVRNWEDYSALVARDNGLAILKKIIMTSPTWLNDTLINTAHIWLEIGYNQANQCIDYLKKYGYIDTTVCKDSFGNNRVVTGRVHEANDPLSLSEKRVCSRRPT